MIKSAVIASALVCLLAGCEKSAAPSTTGSAPPPDAPTLKEEAPAAKEAASKSKTSPSSSNGPSTAGATSQEQPAAIPEPPKKPGVNSVVYATTRISITSDDGVFAVPPATPLRVVQVTDTGFRVSDGKREFDVAENQVSTGLAAASTATMQEQAHRAADAAWHKTQQEALQKQREAANQYATAAAAEKKTRDLQARLDALIREEGQLTANLNLAQRQVEEARIARAYGRVYTRSITVAQESAWAGRLASVQAERFRVQSELSRQ